MTRNLKRGLLGAALALSLSSPAFAREVVSAHEAREDLARGLASLVNEPSFGTAFRDHQTKGHAPLGDLLSGVDAGTGQEGRAAFTDGLRDIERKAIRLRGLDGVTDHMYQVRLHGADGESHPDLSKVWTATVSKDPQSGEKIVVAFEPSGRSHTFPLDAAPNVPMLMVESDGAAVAQAASVVMNRALQSKGVQVQPGVAASHGATRGTRAFLPDDSGKLAGPGMEELSILERIILQVDKEPDIQGDSEIFAIVSGIGPDGKPQLKTQQMPWLDRDKTWYTPRMDLVNWTDYSTNYVNVQLFEDDGETNFKALAVALTEAVGDAAVAISPGAPPALIVAAVSRIGGAILGAMDEKWFRNDIDYVDSFYVLERGKKYLNHTGAANNATITLTPYTVE